MPKTVNLSALRPFMARERYGSTSGGAELIAAGPRGGQGR